jgi:phenylalanyl-tRNA synthetase beta subunit
MLELGQPLHAFDAAKLDGALNARVARDGEEFLALDGKSYKLTPQHLVIADGTKAVAIAGVMGGEESGVTAQTTEIWLRAHTSSRKASAAHRANSAFRATPAIASSVELILPACSSQASGQRN